MKIFRFVFLLFIFVLAAFSCSTDGNLPDILRSDPEVAAPALLDFHPVSSTEVLFTFSKAVSVVSIEFDPELETDSIGDGTEVRVTFAKEIAAGIKVTADILVEDSGKNSLNVIVPFRSRNNRMPKLVFNELRTEYSKPKAEFVEFLAGGAGNLGAMRLFIASNSMSEPAYEFPPAEVAVGEYIVLHLRTVDDGCMDETGPDLALSGGTDSNNAARDFWIPGTSEMFRKSDALWLMDQDDHIVDAVVFNESDTAWAKDYIAEAAKFLAGEGAWLPFSEDDNGGEDWIPSLNDVVISKGTTVAKTICRDDDLPAKPRAGNWYLAAANSATPGEKNKSNTGGVQQNSGSTPNNPAPNNPAPVETIVFLGYRQVSSTEIVFEFSLPIQSFSISFDSSLKHTSKKEGRELKITFNGPLDEGKIFTADIQVKDSSGKSLKQTIPFMARNDRMPDIIFNEIRTENSKPRAEFVEFLILKPGNLGAIKLFISGYSLSKPVYEFPTAEVKAGDYITLHLRTTEEGCVDETGSDLALSGGPDARDNARDFWINGNTKLLHKTDALWLMDQDGRIIDAVVLCEKSSEWGKCNSAAAAEFLEQKGAWLPSGDFAGAVITSATAATRTICRDETLPPIPMADNWYITVSSGATPGEKNNPRRNTP